MEGVDEDLIHRYYGVFGPRPRPENTQENSSASSNSSEDSGHPEGLPYHDAAEIPVAPSPFATPEQKQRFDEALEMVLAPNAVQLPHDVGSHWVWDSVQGLRVGRARKETAIQLPEEVWKDRAIRWAKARDALDWFLLQQE